jgi:voltage-gated potassium channel
VPVTTLPEERFRFSRIKDDPLRAILQRVGLAFALILLVAIVTYLTRSGFANSPDASVPLTFIDALYFSAVSVTTTGYGDIVPVTQGARLENIFLVTPARILFLVLLVGTTLEVLAERSRFLYRLRNWQKDLRNHIVVCGFGIKGQSSLEYLRKHQGNIPAVAIDQDSGALEAANAMDITGILGSSYDTEILKAAMVDAAKTVVIALSSDEDTVLTILRVRELNAKANIVASCRKQSNMDLLRSSGADQVIVSSSSAGRILGMSAEAPDAAEVVNDLLTFGAGLDIDERVITSAGESPSGDGSETVVAIIRSGEVIRPGEPGFSPTKVDDRVVFVTRREKGADDNAAAPTSS